MENLFDKWKTKIPKYSEEYKEMLFESLSKKFGGSEKIKVDLGKHFSNNYELYIYAYFLGLYNNEFIPIPDNVIKVDFKYAISNWGSKGNRLERKDFTNLQEFIFTSLIAKTDVDLISLEKGEITEEEVIKQLIHTLESYTNGGLTLIKEKMEENSNYFLQHTSFLSMILDSKLSTEKVKKKKK
jgi:hypothetical protein